MPELPEVEALAAFLRDKAVGRIVTRVDQAAISAVKTFAPPLSALSGSLVTGVARHGKFLDLDVDGLHLIIHLARGGWLRWSDNLSSVPPRPGKGPLALRVHLADPETDPEVDDPETDPEAGSAAAGFDITEAGTQKRLAVYLVRDPAEVPGVARLGPDALSLDVEQLGELLRPQRQQIKGALTDQTVIAGIGNAYSDEILHTARLSPFKLATRLSDAEISALHASIMATLSTAVERSVGQKAATLKGEKRSGLQVHARSGLPCPVCGDTVREVSLYDKSFQYCPTCQTGGKLLADRRMSKLLR